MFEEWLEMDASVACFLSVGAARQQSWRVSWAYSVAVLVLGVAGVAACWLGERVLVGCDGLLSVGGCPVAAASLSPM